MVSEPPINVEEPDIRFDEEKFGDVVHLICHRCSVEELGRVTLHRALYLCDMLTFLRSGVPLTGAEYRRQSFGPAARWLSDALEALGREQRVRVSIRDVYGYPKYDFVSLIEPATNRLSDDERGLINKVIDFVCARRPSELTELSEETPWLCADMGERIPYFSAFGLVPVEITDEDLAWAEQEARRILESA